MNSADLVKAEKVKKFWDAYRACVEAHYIPPQWSGYCVHGVQELVDFQPEIKLRERIKRLGLRLFNCDAVSLPTGVQT